MNDKLLFNIILLGPPASGAKTSLRDRIVRNTFSYALLSTHGIDFLSCGVETKNGIVKLRIWDTAGQDRFRSRYTNYFRNSHCFILGYDITDENSFQSIKNEFYDIALSNFEGTQVKKPLIYLVANKIDLEDEIKVSDEEAMSFANEKKIPYFKVSAKTREGVDFLINHIANSLIKQFSNTNIKENKKIKIDE